MTDDFVLGVIWSVGTTLREPRRPDRLLIRYRRDPDLIDSIARHLSAKARDGVINLSNHPIMHKALSAGWSGRMDKGRPAPDFTQVDFYEWLSGYGRTGKINIGKHTITRQDRSPRTYRRVRVYGSLPLVETVNRMLVSEFDFSPKKPQLHLSRSGDYEGDTFYLSFARATEVRILAEVVGVE